MRVVIRVDASLKMGTGHVMRCLTLAEVLKENEADVEFICRKHVGIISHDTGGAEILSSYVLHQKNLKFSYAEL